MEVKALLVGYMQVDYEVCLKRVWEWWICCWEEVYNQQLCYGRSHQWWHFHISTLVTLPIIIELEAWFNLQTATVVQPQPATQIFDPFSCPKAFCAQHLVFEELFLEIDPRLLKVKPRSIIFIPTPDSTLLHLPPLIPINSKPQSSQLYH